MIGAARVALPQRGRRRPAAAGGAGSPQGDANVSANGLRGPQRWPRLLPGGPCPLVVAALVAAQPAGAWAEALSPSTAAPAQGAKGPVVARVELRLVEGLSDVDAAPPSLQRPLVASAPAGLDVSALPAGAWLHGAAPVTRLESIAYAVSADRRSLWFDSNGDRRLAPEERAEPAAAGLGAVWFSVRGLVRQPEGDLVHEASLPMAVGVPTAPGRPALSRLDAHRAGTLLHGDDQLRIAVIDRTYRGWFSHLGRDELLVDVDGDGRFDTTEESHERYRLGAPFPFGDRDLVVSAVGPLGAWLDLAESQAPARRHASLQVGAVAPALEAKDLGGRPVSLQGHRGRWVLLDFWATWCGPCRAEIPNLAGLSRALPEVAIIGVAADTEAATVRAFVAAQGMTWTHVHDADGAVRAPWRVRSFPRSYLVDPGGRIAAKDIRGPGLVDAVRRAQSLAAPPSTAGGGLPGSVRSRLPVIGDPGRDE